MRFHRLSSGEWFKAVAIGVATAILLSAVMVPALRLGVSPFPKPLALAFAETIFQQPLPLPVGLGFHVAYVTMWSVIFVLLFRSGLTLANAVALGLFLWLAVLVFFFPLVGWGFLGLGIGPALMVAALVSHLLFAVLLWGLCRMVLGGEPLHAS